MNIKVLVSFILGAGIMVYTIIAKGGENPMALVDYKALIIVLGGTVACGAISFNIDRIMLMLKIFFSRMLKGRRFEYRDTIRELMLLADAYRKSPEDMRSLLEKSSDPFMREALEMLLDEVMSESEMREALNMRVQTIYSRYHSDANMFQALGKYPPAMGLMGAVVGMVALLGALGKPGAEKLIGPAMSVALLATFYGIAFANLFVIPVGEHLNGAASELKTKNAMIVEGVFLISAKTNPIVLAEKLNSFLLPDERLDTKEVTGAA